MGRRPNPFSQKNLKEIKKNPILISILLLSNGIIGIIIGAILYEYLQFILILGIILTVIGFIILPFLISKSNTYRTQEKQYQTNTSYNFQNKNSDINLQKKIPQIFFHKDIEAIDKMSGKEFEKYLQSLFIKFGYDCKLTSETGDFGVDLIISKEYRETIIQAKRYSQKVSIAAIQEIIAARDYYNIFSAAVITNNFFTKAAIDLANKANVRLIDRNILLTFIKEADTLPNGVSSLDFILYGVSYYTTDFHIEKYSQNDTTNNEDNWYANTLTKLKQKFTMLCNKLQFSEAMETVFEASKIQKFQPNQITYLHFFYSQTAEIMYRTREKNKSALDYTIKICDLDIDILPLVNSFIELKNISVYALYQKAVILEQQKNYSEAIKTCDLAIKYNINKFEDFIKRKERIAKKINMTNISTSSNENLSA